MERAFPQRLKPGFDEDIAARLNSLRKNDSN